MVSFNVVNSGDDEFEFWVGEELFGRVDVYYTTVDYLVPKEEPQN